MKLNKLLLFFSLLHCLNATTNESSTWDRNTYLLLDVHLPDHNSSCKWVDYDFLTHYEKKFQHDDAKFIYRVNDVGFSTASRARRYVSYIRKLAKRENIDLNVTYHIDKRGMCKEYCTTKRWHINPAPKFTIRDYVRDYIPTPREFERDRKSLGSRNAKMCHVAYTDTILYDEESLIVYYTRNKENRDRDDYNLMVNKLKRFLYLYKYSLSNDGFYAPKLITDNCAYCRVNHTECDTAEMFSIRKGFENKAEFYKEFECDNKNLLDK